MTATEPPTPAPPATAPPPTSVAVLRMPRREVDVEIGTEYPGFRARLWVNYPSRLQTDIKSMDDTRMIGALAQVVLSHNGWADEDGNVLPQPGETKTETYVEQDENGKDIERTRIVYPFWVAIPDELAAALLTHLNAEGSKLPNSLRTRLRASAST